MRTNGEAVLMTINDGLSFWRVYKFSEKYPVTYGQLYSAFVDDFEKYIKKNKTSLKLNFEQMHQRDAVLFTFSDSDVNLKKTVTHLTRAVPLNCEILIKFNSSCFNDNNTSSPSPKYKFPTLSENEAAEAAEKAERVFNFSVRTSLKFYKSASKYSLFQYAEALFKQKKWHKLYSLIEILRERYAQNAQVSLMIAKCYEHFNDNAKSIQAYKEALIFSDSPSLLIECSKLYMNSDKYLSSLLLNRSINCDSTNPNVIIRSMMELISNKKYNDVFNIAFRSNKSIKFLAKSFKKNDELSKSFINFFKNINISSTSLSNEGISLASLFYKNGAVFESLCICQNIFEKICKPKQKENDKKETNPTKAISEEFTLGMNRNGFDGFFNTFLANDPLIKSQSQSELDSNCFIVNPFLTRVYFTILLNEGLYKRFVDTSKEFVSNMIASNDFDALEILGLQRFFEEYLEIVSCPQNEKQLNQKSKTQLNLNQENNNFDDLTERQEAILDCACAISIFLFLIGSCNEIGSFSSLNFNIMKVENDMPFWQLRLIFSILRTISDSLPSLNMTQPSAALIGDENAIMTSYQVATLVRSNKLTNTDSNNNDILTEKNNFLLLPNIIIDISIWKLRKGHKCGQKESFWSRIETFNEIPLIMVELGYADCEYEIPRLMKKNRFSTIGKAIETITDIYISIVIKIQKKYPNTSIVIHPVIPISTMSSPLVFEFNKKMRVKATENNIKILDLFSKYGPLDLAVSDKSFVKYLTGLRKCLVINETQNDV